MPAAALAGRDSPWVGTFTAKHVVSAATPDNMFRVLTEAFGSASESIHISVYELDNLQVGRALDEALDRGVQVTILLEGAPIPKIPRAELYIANRLAAKGAKVFFYEKSTGPGSRTFKYLHAKYSVIDGRRVVVGSGNYGNNGHPVDSSFGNREWEVVLDDRQAADLFEQAFEHDLGLSGEWAAYGSGARYRVDPSYTPDNKVRHGHYQPGLEPMDHYDVPVKTVFAPDNALAEDAILGVLDSAEESLDVEQLNFETYWGGKPYNPDPEDSPLVKAVLKLARAGKPVRILLNNDKVFREPDQPQKIVARLASFDLMSLFNILAGWEGDPSGENQPKRDNIATATYLNKLSKREGLELGVRLLNYKACGLNVLHNKGMIVDSSVTLVSSINWGESAMKFNREAGVLLKSSSIAHYYSRAFEYDWRCSDKAE